MEKSEQKGLLLVYTREPVEGSYPRSLGNSVHMAYSDDGTDYRPFNSNYGMLFATATISQRNTITRGETKMKRVKGVYCCGPRKI